jgi:prepilin-type N-terminal cleavage/methylation domain-containing protein/prepilin-type processing-associated H-X9-DG protein
MRGRRGFTKNSTSGFTLVELLVVIGIIALLISILMPALSGARENANRIKCGANLHTMGIAMTMYVNQYNAYPGHAGVVAGTTAAIWPTRLRLFTNKDQGIFHCPSQEAGFEWTREPPTGSAAKATSADSKYGYEEGELVLAVNTVPSSYGYNDWGTHDPTSDQRQQKGLGGDIGLPGSWGSATRELRASQVKSTSDMIAISDSTCDHSWDWNIDPREVDQWPGKIHGPRKKIIPRGTPDPYRGSNVLFCDGHVEYHTQKELVVITLGNQPTEISRRWNNDNQP